MLPNHIFTCWGKRQLAGYIFSSQVYRLGAKRAKHCVIMVLLYCKVTARFIAGSQQRGINQEKRLLCQAATVWWSTYCQPCLHIIACSIVKVELTLLLSLVYCAALTSHDGKVVTHTQPLLFLSLSHTHTHTRAHMHTVHTYLCMHEQKHSTQSIYTHTQREQGQAWKAFSLHYIVAVNLILCNHGSLHIPVYTGLSHLIRNNSVPSLMLLHI